MDEENVKIYPFIKTPIGRYKLSQATSGGIPINLTHIAVGDGDGSEYDPTKDQITLINQKWIGEINRKIIHPDDPNIVIINGIISDDVGGFFIRELAIIDEDGDAIYISAYPTSYKPMPGSNISKDMILEQWLIIEDADSFTLTVDPNVSRATMKDLMDHNTDLTAHPDLRDAGNIDQTISEAITAHNTDGNAHESIQRELSAINAALTHTATKEDIQIHNTAPTSHEDIRLQLQTQATKIKLLEDMLATDIQQNQTVILFADLSGIRLIKGVYNEEYARIEC